MESRKDDVQIQEAKQTEEERTFYRLFLRLRNIFYAKKICILRYPHSLYKIICNLATNSNCTRYKSSWRVKPFESMEFNFRVRYEDAISIINYYNNLKTDSASFEDEIVTNKTDHRFFPKETIVIAKVKIDSSTLSSDTFLLAVKNQLNNFDEKKLKAYQQQSKVSDAICAQAIAELAEIKPKSPKPPAKSWFSPKLVAGITSVAIISLFVYKAVSKPKEAVNLLTGPQI